MILVEMGLDELASINHAGFWGWETILPGAVSGHHPELKSAASKGAMTYL